MSFQILLLVCDFYLITNVYDGLTKGVTFLTTLILFELSEIVITLIDVVDLIFNFLIFLDEDYIILDSFIGWQLIYKIFIRGEMLLIIKIFNLSSFLSIIHYHCLIT